jgi:hypothetical protein
MLMMGRYNKVMVLSTSHKYTAAEGKSYRIIHCFASVCKYAKGKAIPVIGHGGP